MKASCCACLLWAFIVFPVFAVEPTPPPPLRLNNLVWELLNLKHPEPGGRAFVAPREGFVFLQVEAEAPPEITIDGREVVLRKVGNFWEGMLRTDAGTRTLTLNGKAETLIVRAVGDLVYSMYGKAADPYVTELGEFNWTFLRRHVLDSFNIIIGHETHTGETEITEWTAEGKWWMSQVHLYWNPPSPAAQYEMWQATPGTTHPLMKGMFIDEFLATDKPEADVVTFENYRLALRRVLDQPGFAGRKTYNFVVTECTPAMEKFVRLVVERDQRLAYEWYIPTLPDDHSLTERLSAKLAARRKQWEAAAPGAASTHQLVALALHAQPPATFDEYPQADFYVHLDRQMQFLATDPSFDGICGLMGYYTPYCSEDQLRLFARLLRHYALEGKTEFFVNSPYILPHLKNPDFLEGLDHWKAEAAQEGTEASITTVVAPGFGKLQGRFLTPPGHNLEDKSPVVANGDKALLTRRSKQAPNRISQTLANLEPGSLYVLRFFTGNRADLIEGRSHKYAHAIDVQIEGAEVLPEKHFQAQGARYMPIKSGSFNSDHPYYWNYHQYVFRATQPTAELVLSDWVNPQTPGGGSGEELLWNYMKLQPYFPEDSTTP